MWIMQKITLTLAGLVFAVHGRHSVIQLPQYRSIEATESQTPMRIITEGSAQHVIAESDRRYGQTASHALATLLAAFNAASAFTTSSVLGHTPSCQATLLLRKGHSQSVLLLTLMPEFLRHVLPRSDVAMSDKAGLEQEVGESIAAAADAILKNSRRRLYPDAPVTNRALFMCLPEEDAARLCGQVETACAMLEASQPVFQVESPAAEAKLSGTWLLCYSNAPEITNLVKLPLGLGLEKVYQRVALLGGLVENRAVVRHRWRLLQQVTRAIASAAPSVKGTLNKAGIRNEGNRLDVTFNKIVISLRRLLFLPTPFLRIVARPNGPAEKEGRMPTLDITYVSDLYRISRGGDGSLFVLQRRPDDEVREPLEDLKEVVDSNRTYDAASGTFERG